MSNKFKDEFLEHASKLDALTKDHGKLIPHALNIVEEKDDSATKKLMSKISKITAEENCTDQVKYLSKILTDSLIKYYGYQKVSQICSLVAVDEDPRTLEELEFDLNKMIGLAKVKTQVKNLIAYQRVQKMREENGLKKVKNTLHLAFLGKPGTGKTTVARIVGRIYKRIGLLSKGHFVEASRTDLIAGYQGQTAFKVKKAIEKSKGGVLFIDEAYSITENDHSDSYGRECLTELTKALEDYRDDLVVIVAGYTEPMNKFFESNPGLKSRFNTFIEFDDYSADELEEILITMSQKEGYILSPEAKERAKELFAACTVQKDDNFANGRLVRNLHDDLAMNHAKRVVNIANPSREDLSVITGEDFDGLDVVVCDGDVSTVNE